METVPASIGQRLLWLMDHYRGTGSALNEQVLMRVTGRCDAGAVREATQRLSARHGALRTGFGSRGSRLTQILHPASDPVELREVDVASATDPLTALRVEIGQELTTVVDASRSPLRPTLIHLDADDHMLVLTMHHFCTDDWSNALISRDIRRLYGRVTGTAAALPEVQWQYADWSAWHHELLAGESGEQLFAYWQDQLTGARVPMVPRPATPADPAGQRDWRSAKRAIRPSVTAGLQQTARARRTTLFPLMLAVLALQLHEMTGQDDVTVSSLFANRGRQEASETVGFFVSTLLLRCRLDPGRPFTELIDEARRTVMGAVRHQELPSQLLPPDTVETNNGRTDEVTFQFVGALTTRDDMVGSEHDGLDLKDQLAGRRFTLEFVLVPSGDGGLYALMISDRSQFDQHWTEDFVTRYVELAERVTADPSASLSRLLARR